jgi:hypothetical protein
MDVFLVPTGQARYAPYCEHDDGHDPVDAGAGDRGWLAGLQARFRSMIAAVERERLRTSEEREALGRTWAGRLKARLMRWIAEKVAEQRLLWHLRGRDEARLLYPSDLPETEATRILRASFQRDRDVHLRWFVFDSALFVASGLLAIVPGPNVLAYYFAFRVVGHYLAWHGARHGLERVRWATQPSDALASLRRALALPRGDRRAHVARVQEELQLSHLVRFLDRMAAWSG